MQQESVTLIVAGLGIGGTLGGIIVGHFLARSWQREQWLLDCRKQ
jgi:predicted MFS family arabinose efflux permease